jgi:hypothetical protein
MLGTILLYAAPILGFVAALTALLGPSRKPDQAGIASLTPFGWAAAAFAVIGLTVSLANIGRQQAALRKAEEQLARMRATAQGAFEEGIGQVLDVLTFAALMPYTTVLDAGQMPHDRRSIDLRSARTLADLAALRLDPGARLRAPFIPAAVPFSPTTRPAMTVLMEESADAVDRLEKGLAIFDRSIDAEVLDAASALARAPFLLRMTRLRESWDARSAIEDSSLPEVVNLYFLADTAPNPPPDDYLDLLDRVDRLRAALGSLTGKP